MDIYCGNSARIHLTLVLYFAAATFTGREGSVFVRTAPSTAPHGVSCGERVAGFFGLLFHVSSRG